MCLLLHGWGGVLAVKRGGTVMSVGGGSTGGAHPGVLSGLSHIIAHRATTATTAEVTTGSTSSSACSTQLTLECLAWKRLRTAHAAWD